MDKLKLKWRIFSFLFGFCALLIFVLWLFQTVFLTDMYKLVRTIEMNQAMALVEKNINNPQLAAILTDLNERKEITVVLTKEFSPQIKYDKLGSGKEMPGKPKPESMVKERVFQLQNGQEIGLTFFGMITPVEATVSTLQVQLSIITALMVTFAVILAMIIARRISRPIEEVNKGAKQLALGNYEVHFAGHGFLEITELSHTLNKATLELSKVEALRRELMANLSHDLRTPLALIYSYSEMMHDFPDEITTEQTQMIMDETNRLTSLVNDILDVSRLETGTMELHKKVYNLTKSLRDTVTRVGELIKKDGYTLCFLYEEEVMICADEGKITQAFYNLLLNAVHYSTKEKKITVSQKVSDQWVQVGVKDQGDGIEKEHLPYIWERYYKVDKTHKRATTGSGLGLSIVKRMIELHHGTYGVESEVLKGSTFWFRVKKENSHDKNERR